jgi:hypothetical protein
MGCGCDRSFVVRLQSLVVGYGAMGAVGYCSTCILSCRRRPYSALDRSLCSANLGGDVSVCVACIHGFNARLNKQISDRPGRRLAAEIARPRRIADKGARDAWRGVAGVFYLLFPG